MPIRKPGAVLLSIVFLVSLATGVALAQDSAKQDMKAAGTDTKSAARNTGHAVSTGSKKAYNETADGTKTAAHKQAMAPKRLTTRPKTARELQQIRQSTELRQWAKTLAMGPRWPERTLRTEPGRSATRSQANPIPSSRGGIVFHHNSPRCLLQRV